MVKEKTEEFQLNLVKLLILLIPVQLGRHFFFDFAKIAGIYNDYLIPIFYLSDIVILALIFLDIKIKNIKPSLNVFFFLVILIFSTIFIAEYKVIAIYKLIKIIEFIWLFKIIKESNIKIPNIVVFYSIAILYSSILAILQFANQKSMGGWWWFFGERSFYANTPGIAQIGIGSALYLRPYSSFAHPNVLGGFLALGLPMVYWQFLNGGYKKLINLIYIFALILGVITLALTFSRSAWLVFSLEMLLFAILKNKSVINNMINRKKQIFFGFIILIVLSFQIPLYVSNLRVPMRGSLYERRQLIKASLIKISENPIWGVGLNNSLQHQYQILPKSYGLFTHQPVHNIYILITFELGLCGLIFVLFFIYKSLGLVKNENLSIFIPFLMLFILGLFDHYLISLQQGMLIFVFFAGLYFRKEKSYK